MQQQIIISNDIEHDLATAVAESEHDRVFVLTDDTTHECCLPKVAALLAQDVFAQPDSYVALVLVLLFLLYFIFLLLLDRLQNVKKMVRG